MRAETKAGTSLRVTVFCELYGQTVPGASTTGLFFGRRRVYRTSAGRSHLHPDLHRLVQPDTYPRWGLDPFPLQFFPAVADIPSRDPALRSADR